MFVSPQCTWNSIKIAANYSEGAVVIVIVVEEEVVVIVKVISVYKGVYKEVYKGVTFFFHL